MLQHQLQYAKGKLRDVDGGIAELRSVPDEVVAANGDGYKTALSLRYDLGEVLGSTGRSPTRALC